MKNKVTNLELSRKLKELGVKQESEFYWSDRGTLDCRGQGEKTVRHKDSITEYAHRKFYSAYLSCELGEILPWSIPLLKKIESGADLGSLEIQKVKGDYLVMYVVNGTTIAEYNNEQIYFSTDNLVEPLAKMLIYLLENNLIEL